MSVVGVAMSTCLPTPSSMSEGISCKAALYMASLGRNMTTNSGVQSQLGPVALGRQLEHVGANLRRVPAQLGAARILVVRRPARRDSLRAAPWRRPPRCARPAA